MFPKATLYIIPSLLGGTDAGIIPEHTRQVAMELDAFIVENAKSARHFLRTIGYTRDFDTVAMHELGKHTDPLETIHYLDPLAEGRSIGLISEAGAPAVADPGSNMVLRAHQNGHRVVPLAGPSSILLALMASGLGGQQFTFHGYLPIERKERQHALRRLEQQAALGYTQIFMETPYRNNKLLADITATCQDETLLGIAANLTLPDALVRTQSIKQWRSKLPDLHKKPAIFLIGK